jgi:hypothetical protein
VLDKNFGSKHKLFKPSFFTLFLVLVFATFAQAQKFEKGETIFGIELEGIIPTSLLGAGPLELGNDTIDVTVKSPSGYSFGMIIRHNFTKMFTLETGIHLVQRSYPVSIANTENAFQGKSSIGLQSYEIPIQWLLYIRLGEQFYMNTILGISLDFYPSDVTAAEYSYSYYIQRDSWIKSSLLASVGFEYRTKESGYFYLGASLKSPFGNIGRFYLTYFYDDLISEDVTFSDEMNGSYFSVEFRYFFNKKEKNLDKLIN